MYTLVLILTGIAALADLSSSTSIQHERITTPPAPVPFPRNADKKCNFISESADNTDENNVDGNPSRKKCGISKVTGGGNKIVGGRKALPGEFPWQLSLEMQILPVISEFRHICGASIINENWAVTAAHCIAGGFFSKYRVSAGAYNIKTRKVPSKHIAIPYPHEDYKPNSGLQNDIALLRLTSKMDLEGSDGLMNAVCLPDKSLAENVTGMATVTGWGTTRQGGSLSNELRATDVPIISDAECQQVYGKDFNETMICAGYKEGGKDSCQGDSGGPFVQQSPEGFWTLIGIVSWGKGCAQPNYPGVYTEVAHYMDWITKTMNNPGSVPGYPGSNGGSGNSQANYQAGGSDSAPGVSDDVIIKEQKSLKSLFKM